MFAATLMLWDATWFVVKEVSHTVQAKAQVVEEAKKIRAEKSDEKLVIVDKK